MEIKLHANATTTPRIRRYLQQSNKSDRELAKELGISVTTVRRWRHREQINDRQTTPGVVHKALRPEQIALINILREWLRAPLDELLFLVVEGLGISVSRATLNRYLKPVRRGQVAAPLQGKKALKAGLHANSLQLHYVFLPLHMDDGGDHHLLWAQEPVSGWLYAHIYSGISQQRVVNWLEDALIRCPADIQSVETDDCEWFEASTETTIGKCLAAKSIEHSVSSQQTMLWGEFSTPPLRELYPAFKDKTLDEVLQHLCELWNSGKGQKKLGECTPQHFLKALRQTHTS